MVDTWKGKLRVRKWPKKRGPKKTYQQQVQVDRFTAAQRLAKRAPGAVQADWIRATKGTDFYPRDIGTKMILNGPFEIELPDGSIQRPGRRQLFKVTFQGFSARLKANQVIPGSSTTDVTWPTPELDTAGFFNPAQPDRITIPDGVTRMSFNGGTRTDTVTAGIQLTLIRRISSPTKTLCSQGQDEKGGQVCSSGPVAVQPGEQYALACFVNPGDTIIAEQTFFGGTVLEADPP